MKIAVLGATGMLGSAVAKHMSEVFGLENVWVSHRSPNLEITSPHSFYLDVLSPEGCYQIPLLFDYIVNCIGTIKPLVEQVGVENTVRINSLFPLELERYCKICATRLIHITTDCVFSGEEGNYTEMDYHDCLDVYGKTKSLGEPSEHAMTIRTSIIGEELHNKVSLIEWAKANKGRTVSGYTNHLWNGITTLQYSKACEKIINQDLYHSGKAHVFSPEPITKEGLLHLINEKYNLNLTISPTEAIPPIDRTLSTVSKFNSLLNIPSIPQQIMEL